MCVCMWVHMCKGPLIHAHLEFRGRPLELFRGKTIDPLKGLILLIVKVSETQRPYNLTISDKGNSRFLHSCSLQIVFPPHSLADTISVVSLSYA